MWNWLEDESSPNYFLIKSGDINICIMQSRDSDMGLKTDPTRKQCIANARLISAAPDLLAALQDLARHCEWLDSFEYCPELKRAHDAIAKARGES